MPVTITVNANNLITRLKKILDNEPQALQAAGLVLQTAAQQRITSGSSDWPAWSPQYAKWSEKHPHQMEWLNGTLVRSLTIGDSNNVFELGPHQITIGSNVTYAAAQNFGYPDRNLPARPFLVVDDADTNAKAAQAFLKFLLQE